MVAQGARSLRVEDLPGSFMNNRHFDALPYKRLRFCLTEKSVALLICGAVAVSAVLCLMIAAVL